jgi:4-hydroxybenzoate polyprenyltransferase
LWNSGFLVNSLTDIEVDMKYKTRVSGSVGLMGKRVLFWLLVAHVGIAFLLSCHIAFILSDPFLLAWVILGIFFGIGYSVKPFHFKIRGPLHVLSLSMSALFIPGIFLYVCMAGWPSIPILVILSGFTILHYGIALANQSGDYLEDGDAELSTPAVRWGLKNTLVFGLVLLIVGMVIMMVGLVYRLSTIGTTVPFTMIFGVFLIPLVIAVGYSTPIRGMYDLFKISKIENDELGKKPEVARSDLIKKRMNYPKWQASGIYSTFACTLAIFALIVFFPAVNEAADDLDLPVIPDYSGVNIYGVSFSNGLTSDGQMDVSLWVDVNETHVIDDLYINCQSTLGKEVLENGTYRLTDVRTSDASQENIRVGFLAKTHELNDTAYNLKLYRRSETGSMVLLDTHNVGPKDEIFITDITYSVQEGVVKDSLSVEVTIYNRLNRRAPDTLSVLVSGNLHILPASEFNNQSVEADSYWTSPLIKIEIPKNPSTYEVRIQYNGEDEDLQMIDMA